MVDSVLWVVMTESTNVGTLRILPIYVTIGEDLIASEPNRN